MGPSGDRRAPLASVLTALAGAAATWRLLRARLRATLPFRDFAGPAAHRSRWRIGWSRRSSPFGDPTLISWTARIPQTAIVVPLTAAAIAAAWFVRPDVGLSSPRDAFMLGGGAFVLAFPLLIAERGLALRPVSPDFPEAQSLRALLFVVLLCLATAGLLGIVDGLGMPLPAAVGLRALAFLPLAIAVELMARALGRLFLPPPDPADARATTTSTIALILAEGAASRGLTAPLRHHLGIDFSRGWALGFVRRAFPAVLTVLLLIVWGMTGVIPVPFDQRAIYERFGEPVAVLPPGPHLILPWPLGRARPVEFGLLHELPLGSGDTASVNFGAEDNPPSSSNLLWEQAHPAEVQFLIATESTGRQNFQVVSADIRLIWRIGLTDNDAMHAHYAVVDPPALLRSAASRVVARFFAGETLPSVLGEAREAVAARLRELIQHDLDRAGCGLELAGLVIEAVHPPAGAADAWHAVQAAEIGAVAQISAERGHAQAEAAKAAQYAADIIANAHARAADTIGEARSAAILFSADVASARAGGPSFPLNRSLTDIAAALHVSPLTIIDHRIPATDAPMLDLRPPGPLTPPTGGAE